MSKDPHWIDSDALAYEAALTMMQKQIHHLPVCDDGELVGMVSRSDFMRLETEHPLYLVNDIAKQTTVDGIVERLPPAARAHRGSDQCRRPMGNSSASS